MPDAATQTDDQTNEAVNAIEHKLKHEAIQYVHGTHPGPPSTEMLRWLAKNDVPKEALVPIIAFADLTEAEEKQMAAMRKENLARLLRLRELGKEERLKSDARIDMMLEREARVSIFLGMILSSLTRRGGKDPAPVVSDLLKCALSVNTAA
ncbi:hypothetical protein B0H17DRAFT_1137097, partial [Mycena rosella]